MTSLSVIVPCYQQAEFVNQCIDSLLACNPPPDEIIASDNFCPFGSLDSLEIYKDRIRIVRPTSHLAMTHHLNFLMSQSSSDYTSIVCADDFVAPGYVRTLKRMAKKYPAAAILRAGWHNVDIDGNAISTRRLNSLFLSRVRDYPETFIEACGGSKNPLLSWAVNTRLFKSIGFFDAKTDICDWSAFLALSELGLFVTECRPIAFYRSDYRPELSRKRAHKHIEDSIYIGKEYVMPRLRALSSRQRRIAINRYSTKIASIYGNYLMANSCSSP